MEIIVYFIEISLMFVPKGPIDNKSSSIQIMTWRLIGAKPLYGSMMTQYTNVYVRLRASKC